MQSARSVQQSRSVELRQSSSVKTCFSRQQVRTLTVCRVHVSSLVTQDSSNVSDQFLPSFHMINSEFLYLTYHLTICCSTKCSCCCLLSSSCQEPTVVSHDERERCRVPRARARRPGENRRHVRAHRLQVAASYTTQAPAGPGARCLFVSGTYVRLNSIAHCHPV